MRCLQYNNDLNLAESDSFLSLMERFFSCVADCANAVSAINQSINPYIK